MPTRFDEAPEDAPLLTPELAERVVERFAERQAERQRAEAAEREHQASLTRVQELADLLGTTPEDIRELAQEEASRVPPQGAAQPFPPRERPRWPIHVAYLTGFTLLIVAYFARLEAIHAASLQHPSDFARTFGRFDPYVKISDRFDAPIRGYRNDTLVSGYRRDLGVAFPWQQTHELLVSPDLVAPPTGFRVKLIVPEGDKAIAGSPGKVDDTPATRETLRRSILSMLAHEESLTTISGDIPIVDYAHAPSDQSDALFQGSPGILGWHDVEVSNGLGTYRALLPDRRYAKDLGAYQAALRWRLDNLLDAKFSPACRPAIFAPVRSDSPRRFRSPKGPR